VEVQQRLGAGAVLAILGGLGMALGPTLGATTLSAPWSFIAGFVDGVVTGIGVVLCVSGLIQIRHAG
jgi:hypothetical protein